MKLSHSMSVNQFFSVSDRFQLTVIWLIELLQNLRQTDEANQFDSVCNNWVYYFWMCVVNCGSYLIRLRDSFIINISGNNWDLKTSYVKLVIRGRKHPRDYHFWLCVAMSTSCPIRLNNSFISINSFNNFMGIGKNKCLWFFVWG